MLKAPVQESPETSSATQKAFVQLAEQRTKEVDIAEYEVFLDSIRSAQSYRLPHKLASKKRYPVPEPDPTPFPQLPPVPTGICPVQPAPAKTTLKWFHYVFFWQIPVRRRITNEANDAAMRKYKIELSKYAKHVRMVRELETYWKISSELYQRICDDHTRQWKTSRDVWEEAWREEAQLLQRFETGFVKRTNVVEYLKIHLSAVPAPHFAPYNVAMAHDPGEEILVADCELPYFPALTVVKTRELKNTTKVVPATSKETSQLVEQFMRMLVLRLMWEIAALDHNDVFRFICCNGWVSYDDPGTGHPRRDSVLSIGASPNELRALRLERVDPVACFKRLRGVSSGKLTDLVPIIPIIRFDTKDERFVKGRDVLEGVRGENLAVIDWQEFEHLTRELFEKEFASKGAEVRITRASRDRGVDAIVFDPDPLRGGKLVLQAKRYSNTVDVSAVRDLYGTVQAEGANKGILVTTSGYGADSYEFAKDKPITLINGSELLALLRKHGYSMRIDLKEAKELLRSRRL